MMSKLTARSTAVDNEEFEFACDEGMYRSPQKRKQNALDYYELAGNFQLN